MCSIGRKREFQFIFETITTWWWPRNNFEVEGYPLCRKRLLLRRKEPFGHFEMLSFEGLCQMYVLIFLDLKVGLSKITTIVKKQSQTFLVTYVSKSQFLMPTCCNFIAMVRECVGLLGMQGHFTLEKCWWGTYLRRLKEKWNWFWTI